jgi:hypothetical protein
MRDWLEMTDGEQDAANVEAYAYACDRLRCALDRNPGAEMQQVREDAAARLADDVAEYRRLIRRAERSRATKADRASGEYARRSLPGLGLVEGFLWEAEI